MQNRKFLWGAIVFVGVCAAIFLWRVVSPVAARNSFDAIRGVASQTWDEVAYGNGKPSDQNEIVIDNTSSSEDMENASSVQDAPTSLGAEGRILNKKEKTKVVLPASAYDDVDSSSDSAAPLASTTAQPNIDLPLTVSSSPSDTNTNPPSSALSPATSSCSFSFPSALGAPSSSTFQLSRKVIFNEIAWMGSLGSSNGEWMEIKNDSGSDVDLSGWEIVNASDKIKIYFVDGDHIPARGFFLLARTSAVFSNNITPQKTYSGDLRNAGDDLALVDISCNLSDFLEASSTGWPAGNNTTKQTMERDADGVGWHTSVAPGGTPDQENSMPSQPVVYKATISSEESGSSTAQINFAPVSPAPAASNIDDAETSSTADVTPTSTSPQPTTATTTATSTATAADTTATDTPVSISSSPNHLLIAAIQIAGATANDDFIKIYNPTASPVDMSGWKLRKKSQSGTDYSVREFPAATTIVPQQYFVWANSADGFAASINADASSTQTLAADNSVALMDANGAIVDAVAWGTGAGQYGEGPPYPTDPIANQILMRQLANGVMVDTDNNANDFALQ